MTRSDHAGIPARPHQGGWGEPSSREQLWRIAEDLRRRSGFGICAIEVRRSDDQMEFVAIAAEDLAARDLEGQSSPLGAMWPVIDLGDVFGIFSFIRVESVTQDAHESIAPYVVIPEGVRSDAPNAWHPEDMLVVRLHDASTKLRAFVYFDLPDSLCRPTESDLLRLSTDLDVTLQAVITTIEREEYAAAIRFATGVRQVVRSSDSGQGLDALLRVAGEELRQSFRAKLLAVQVFGEELVMNPPGGVEIKNAQIYQAVEGAARGCWARQRVLLVSASGPRGDNDRDLDLDLDPALREQVAAALPRLGWGELVIVPVGAGDEALGMLGIARATGSAAWTDDESSAALDVGHDLGRAILNARASQREREASEELRRVDDFRKGLISTLAHELKNPIGVVVGHVEMLASMPEVEHLPDAAQLSLDAVSRGADRVATLVDDLTMLVKVGDPHHGLNAAPVDLRQVVSVVVEQARLSARQRDIKLVCNSSPAPLVVLGDETSLTSVVTNLTTNAISYSSPGGSVALSVWRHGDEVILECCDEGLGISTDDLAHLFTEFFRSTNREALVRPGTGLGLTITQRIVERHGGRIEVESELGAGSTFRVFLPVAGLPDESVS